MQKFTARSSVQHFIYRFSWHSEIWFLKEDEEIQIKLWNLRSLRTPEVHFSGHNRWNKMKIGKRGAWVRQTEFYGNSSDCLCVWSGEYCAREGKNGLWMAFGFEEWELVSFSLQSFERMKRNNFLLSICLNKTHFCCAVMFAVTFILSFSTPVLSSACTLFSVSRNVFSISITCLKIVSLLVKTFIIQKLKKFDRIDGEFTAFSHSFSE